jgi:hypothetical protein
MALRTLHRRSPWSPYSLTGRSQHRVPFVSTLIDRRRYTVARFYFCLFSSDIEEMLFRLYGIGKLL